MLEERKEGNEVCGLFTLYKRLKRLAREFEKVSHGLSFQIDVKLRSIIYSMSSKKLFCINFLNLKECSLLERIFKSKKNN